MLQIRKPEAEELQNLLLLLLKFGDDFKDIFPEADVIKVGQVIQQHYDDGFISNAYINDKLVGSIGAMKTPWWFSKQEFVAETWFYVLPEHRSYKIAKKLINELKKYGKDMTIQMPISSGVDGQIYKKFGFKKMGSIWRYN